MEESWPRWLKVEGCWFTERIMSLSAKSSRSSSGGSESESESESSSIRAWDIVVWKGPESKK